MRNLSLFSMLAVTAFAGALSAQSKGLTVNGGEGTSVTFGGSHRTRLEVRSPFSYADDAPANRNDHAESDVMMRTRVNADFMFPNKMNAFVEFQDARNFGGEAGAGANTSSGEELHLLQGYVHAKDMFNDGCEFWLGRQKFTIGNQRLVSTLEWSNTGRSWDGLRMKHTFNDSTSLQLFATVITDGAFAQDEEYFIGGNLLYKQADYDVEAVALLERDMATATEFTRWTLSLRSDGKVDQLSYSLEGVYQFGEQGDSSANVDIGAYAFAAKLDYNVAMEGAKFVIGAGYDYASGDDDATDGEVGTFMAPFPFGHKYNGWSDVVGWSNLHDIYVTVNYSRDAWSFAAQGHYFMRAEENDGMYNTTGALVRAGGAAADDVFGYDLDFSISYQVNAWMTWEAAWAHFVAGDFISDTDNGTGVGGAGEDGDTDYIWTSVSVNF